MSWFQIALGLAVIAVGSTQSTGGTYMLIMPRTMRPGQNFDVSIIYNYTKETANEGPVSVTVALQNKVEEGETPLVLHQDSFLLDLAPCGLDFVGGCPVSDVLRVNVPEGDRLVLSKYVVEVSGHINGLYRFKNSSEITVIRKTVSVMVQTDKSMYKPSQTVNFRVLSITSNLKPAAKTFNISIHDPADNKIKQWLNKEATGGMITLKLELSDQPNLGTWNIQVKGEDTGETKSFEVAEYVLPKVEISVDAPSFLLSNAEKFMFSVEAKYTYGQPMKGNCTIVTMFKKYRYDNALYGNITDTKNLTNGKIEIEIKMDDILKIYPRGRYENGPVPRQYMYLNGRELVVSAKCQDQVTAKQYSENATTPIRDQKYKLQILDITAATYKPGMNYTCYVKLTLADDTPPAPSELKHPNGSAFILKLRDVENRVYYRYQSVEWYAEQARFNWTAEFDNTGLAIITFPVPLNRTTRLDLRASLNVSGSTYTRNKYVDQFKSRDKQSIQVSIMDSTGELKIGDEVKFKIATSQATKQVYLQLLSKGKVPETRVVTSAVPEQVHIASVTLTPELTQKLAPSARCVVFCSTNSGEILADSLDFSVDGAFANDVRLEFNTAEARPGTSVQLTVSAHPDSMVALMAVDQSTLLLGTGNDITRDQVIEELQGYDSTNVDNGYGRPGPFPRGLRGKRSFWCYWCYSNRGGKDTLDLFNNAGLIIRTDGYIYQDPPPRYFLWGRRGQGERGERGQAGPAQSGQRGQAGPAPAAGRTAESAPGASSSSLQQPQRVRTNFVETWLWQYTHTGADGRVHINTTVPDTITSWVTSALAMHSTVGLGITDTPAKLTVFKPFFVSLDLPYSVIRGEEIELKVVVFNYLPDKLPVTITIEKSSEFAVMGENEVEYKRAQVEARMQVSGGDGRTFSVWIVPLVLGQMNINVKAQSAVAADAVRRKLLVEPEGVLQSYDANFMIDLSEETNNIYEQTVDLELPSDGLVDGSVKITATAIGDIMGPALSNLDHLIRMPSGCGEQNMVNFVPNIYVMDYLKSSGHDYNQELKTKAITYMEKGYQRELTYQRYDGSFSAFGNRDAQGSVWLSAFVLKSFCEAKEYIALDVDKVHNVVQFLLSKQDKEGKFIETGKVFHREMQGGAASGVSLTGYVVTALLESCHEDVYITNEVNAAIEKGINYLLSRYDSGMMGNNSYILSITAYTLASAKHPSKNKIFNKLNELVTEEGGMKYWAKPAPDNTWKVEKENGRQIFTPPRRQAGSSDIERTSYALLAMVMDDQIVEAIPTMKWVVSQRNGNGGYSSTQDTVMALQALAKYASAIMDSGSQELDVTLSAAGEIYAFPQTITSTNRLVLQRLDVTSAQNERLMVRAEGRGTVLVQVSVEYNIQETYNQPGMNLDVISTEMGDGVVYVEISVWYTPDDPSQQSGMVVVEATPLSGYTAINLDELRDQVDGLQRVEQVGKKYVFYFEELLVGEKKTMVIHTERQNRVANLKKAHVSAYSYYEPTVNRDVFYLPRFVHSVNEVCTASNCTNLGTPNNGIQLVLIDITDLTGGEKNVTDPGTKVIHHERKPNILEYSNSSNSLQATFLTMIIMIIMALVGVYGLL